MKNWLIAGSVFIVGIFAAVLIGKRDQKKDDAEQAEAVVSKSLDKISEASKDVQATVAKDVATGGDPSLVDHSLQSDFEDKE